VVEERLLAEFAGAQSGAVIAYRGRYRWKRGYQKISVPGANPRLKTGGVYLITGGPAAWGWRYPGIWLRRAGRLSCSRSKRGAQAQQRLRRSRNIEALGARVEVMVAEASDRDRCTPVVAGILKKFRRHRRRPFTSLRHRPSGRDPGED
jgi:hypothetical protein